MADGQIELSWAANGQFRLESTTLEELSSGNWRAVATEPRLVQGVYVVLLPMGQVPQLFRLRAIER